MEKDLKKMILEKLMSEMDDMESEKLKKPKAMEVSVEAKELSPMEAKKKIAEAMASAPKDAEIEVEMEPKEEESEDEEDYGSDFMKRIMAMKKAKKEKMG